MDFCSIPLASKLCSAADAIDFVNDPGKAITEGIGNWIAKSAGEFAAASADLAAEAVNATTKVDLRAGWFVDNYELLLPIGLTLLVATFCGQLVRAAVKRDGQALAQAFTGTVSGVIFCFVAIAGTTIAIEVVDALSDGLFAAAGTSIEEAVRRMVKASSVASMVPLGWMIPGIVGIGAGVGAILYWCVMMVRKVGILVLVTLAVFAGAGGGWEAARRWRRGWIEATATLVVSKLLMTIVFLLGISALGQTQAKDGLGALADCLAGVVIMMMVLLCPYATFKFVHWAAEGTDGESIHRAGGTGAQMAKQHTEQAARKAAAMAATGGAGAAAAGGGASPQGSAGFPGDIAANPTGGQGEQNSSPMPSSSGSPAADALAKAVQPPPTSPSQDTSGQPGAGPGAPSDPGGTGPVPRSTQEGPPRSAPVHGPAAAGGPVASGPSPTGS
ncbi:SCO6881 family protein [Streptomyces antarcticus]|uniref:SCO6881 family protein n=1 Tax=Streptomyces antarcticus TaxID=2996458 RepID=UPI00226DFEF6|nr:MULTISPECIES: ATP-binding protein [unclassified Streptomyces]MCY0942360.1 ATP-binding protein [Streptomyces sp. H34-AA3]MCZ4080643.1 ATP-binding protein [Streptomyces sp. H34-S5]